MWKLLEAKDYVQYCWSCYISIINLLWNANHEKFCIWNNELKEKYWMKFLFRLNLLKTEDICLDLYSYYCHSIVSFFTFLKARQIRYSTLFQYFPYLHTHYFVAFFCNMRRRSMHRYTLLKKVSVSDLCKLKNYNLFARDTREHEVIEIEMSNNWFVLHPLVQRGREGQIIKV